jgi:hypothetical protein
MQNAAGKRTNLLLQQHDGTSNHIINVETVVIEHLVARG